MLYGVFVCVMFVLCLSACILFLRRFCTDTNHMSRVDARLHNKRVQIRAIARKRGAFEDQSQMPHTAE